MGKVKKKLMGGGCFRLCMWGGGWENAWGKIFHQKQPFKEKNAHTARIFSQFGEISMIFFLWWRMPGIFAEKKWMGG